MTTCFFSGQTTIVPLVIGKKAAEGHYCGADHGHFCGADAMKDALSNLKVKRAKGHRCCWFSGLVIYPNVQNPRLGGSNVKWKNISNGENTWSWNFRLPRILIF